MCNWKANRSRKLTGLSKFGDKDQYVKMREGGFGFRFANSSFCVLFKHQPDVYYI